ncbi:hypothetical protein D9M72_460710 [compost metagenome]
MPADGVAGVLPALVHQALAGGVEVFQEAVPVQVAMVPEPFEGVLEVGQEFLHLGIRHAGFPGVVQEADPQRRGVNGSVVHRRQAQGLTALGHGQDGPADLVQDLAGLDGRGVVRLGALPAGERAERTAGDGRVDGQQHARRNDGVAPEHGEEPRGAGRQERVMRMRVVRQAQAVEVADGPFQEPAEPGVV